MGPPPPSTPEATPPVTMARGRLRPSPRLTPRLCTPPTDTTTTDTPVLATPPSPDPLSTPPATPPSPAPLSPATPRGPSSPATLPGPLSPPDTEDTASTDSASTRHIHTSRYQQAQKLNRNSDHFPI